MPHFWSLLGAASAPACRLAALLALLVGAAGCGADAGPDAGTDPPPDPAPDGCVSYGQYATGAVPCGTVVAWVGGLVTDLDVQDGIAVLASLTSGLRVVDVSDPRLPRLVGTAASPGALAVDLQDGLVAIAEGVHGFSLYDISDPTAPLHLVRQSVTTAVASPGATDAVALAGDRLFVAGFHRNLVCYDVSDPRRPVERGRLVMDRPGDLAVVGDRLVAGGRAVVSIATDGNLAMVAELPHGAAEDLCVADATVYAAVAEGLAVYDLSAADTVGVAEVQPLAGARCVAVADDRVFLGALDTAARLHVFAATIPSAPVALAEFPVPGYAMFSCLGSSEGMLLAGDRHLRTIDVGDPGNPVFLPEPPEPAYPQGVVAVGSSFGVYEGARVYLLHADPASPPVVLACGQTVVHAAANSSHMYFARATGGLVVVDPASPAPPVIQHRQTYFGPLAASDSLLAVGSGGSLRLYNLADPAAPVFGGELRFDDYIRQIAIHGPRILVSLAAAQLALVDAVDPTHPRVIGVDDPDLQLEESAAIAWRDSSGLDYHAGGALRLVRLAADGRIVTISAVGTGGTARALAVAGPVAYTVGSAADNAAAAMTAIDFGDQDGLLSLGRALRPWTTLLRLQVADDRVYGLTPGGILAYPLDCRSLPGASR